MLLDQIQFLSLMLCYDSILLLCDVGVATKVHLLDVLLSERH